MFVNLSIGMESNVKLSINVGVGDFKKPSLVSLLQLLFLLQHSIPFVLFVFYNKNSPLLILGKQCPVVLEVVEEGSSAQPLQRRLV